MSRALLVSPVSPWAESFGAQQRTAHLYRALAALVPVDILLLTEGSEDRAEAGDRPEILASLSWKQPTLALGKYGVHAWADRWCRSNLDWAKYSLVVGRYLTPVSKIAWPSHLRVIVDCDDALYRYLPPWGGLAGRAAAAAQGWLRYRQTKSAITRYDHAFFSSLRDCRVFPARSSSVLHNTVPVPPEPPAAPGGSSGSVLIVGSLWYPPNRQGVDWFLQRCWPGIAARCPEVSLRIVGPAPIHDRERWGSAVRTEAPGFVDDLATEYSRALLAVAPIHYGGGTCIKFLEAAAHCRVCIATGHVFAVFSPDFRAGYSAVVARDAGEMIESAAALLQDADRRNEIARRAYETTADLYNVERFTKAVQDTVRRVTAAPGGRNSRAPRISDPILRE